MKVGWYCFEGNDKGSFGNGAWAQRIWDAQLERIMYTGLKDNDQSPESYGCCRHLKESEGQPEQRPPQGERTEQECSPVRQPHPGPPHPPTLTPGLRSSCKGCCNKALCIPELAKRTCHWGHSGDLFSLSPCYVFPELQFPKWLSGTRSKSTLYSLKVLSQAADIWPPENTQVILALENSRSAVSPNSSPPPWLWGYNS